VRASLIPLVCPCPFSAHNCTTHTHLALCAAELPLCGCALLVNVTPQALQALHALLLVVVVVVVFVHRREGGGRARHEVGLTTLAASVRRARERPNRGREAAPGAPDCRGGDGPPGTDAEGPESVGLVHQGSFSHCTARHTIPCLFSGRLVAVRQAWSPWVQHACHARPRECTCVENALGCGMCPNGSSNSHAQGQPKGLLRGCWGVLTGHARALHQQLVRLQLAAATALMVLHFVSPCAPTHSRAPSGSGLDHTHPWT
jgi:hypothetical protein